MDVNLVQTFKFDVADQNQTINAVVSSGPFIERLDDELEQRLLKIDGRPTIADPEALVKDVKTVTYPVIPSSEEHAHELMGRLAVNAKVAHISFGALKTGGQRLETAIDTMMTAKFAEMKSELTTVKSQLDLVTNSLQTLLGEKAETESSLIVRQLVKELRIHEIEQAFKNKKLQGNLPDLKDDSNYATCSQRMRDFIKENGIIGYLKRLFEYKLKDHHANCHKELRMYTPDQVIEAISFASGENYDVQKENNGILYLCYEKWNSVLKPTDTQPR